MPVPIILTPPSLVDVADATGLTLQRYRRGLADEIGQLAILTTTATPSVGTTHDAKRQILAAEIKASGRMPDELDGCWVYVVDGDEAGEVRRVWKGGYHAAIASLLVDEPFSAPLVAGTEIEITDTLPAKRKGMTFGLRECLNEGLERLPVIDRVAVSIVAGQLRYALSGYSWPIKGIRGVYEPRAAADDPLVETRQTATIAYDGDQPQLVLSSGFSTGTSSTFDLELLRPANTWIRSGGAWGDSTVGLVNETDAALYDVLSVVWMAAPIALMHLGQQHPLGSPERAARLAEYEERKTVAAIARWYGSFGRGAAVQRVGARGGSRGRWWNSW